MLTAAIVGSLGCGVLFVIALGCTRRLFHVQTATSCSSRARRNLQSLANILQVREAPPTYEVAMGIEVSCYNKFKFLSDKILFSESNSTCQNIRLLIYSSESSIVRYTTIKESSVAPDA